MHLKGRFLDEKEAIAYYQKARPRNQAVVEEATRFAKECFEFLSRQKKTQGELTPAEERYLKQVAGRLAQQQVEAIIQGKLDASYWLGLIQYELGQYDYEAWKIAESQGKSAFAQKKFDEAMDYFTAALDYFRVRTLQFGAAIRPEGLLGCRGALQHRPHLGRGGTAAKGDRPVRVHHPFTERCGEPRSVEQPGEPPSPAG